MEEKQENSNLMDIYKLLGKTWQIYNSKLGTLLGITALPMLAVIPIIIIGLPLGLLSALSAAAIDVNAIAGFLPLIIFFVIAISLIGLWSQLALIYAVQKQGKPGVKDSYMQVKGKVFGALWISLMTGLVISFGYLFFIVPGIIFTVWYQFSLYALVLEGLKGLKAISQSKKLVNGRWWPVFGRTVFIITILFVLSFIIEAFSKWPGMQLAARAMTLFVTPITSIYFFLLYQDLKDVKGEEKELPEPNTSQ